MRRASTEQANDQIALSSRQDLVARICWYHFREGNTQQQVADRVGLSRMTVNKIISDAVEQGYVQISVDTPLRACFQMEADLKAMYRLEDAIVIPSPDDDGQIRHIIGLATGDFISRTLQPNQILGLSWGGTIHGAAQSLRRRSNSGNVIVSLSGGLSKSAIINPYDNAAMFARLLDAECHYLTAPMFADNPRMKKMLMSSRAVCSLLEMARRIDLALLTAVDLTTKTWIIKHGALTPAMVKDLVDAGSVGAVSDHYIDAEGRLIEHSINERTITVPLEILLKVPKVVVAAGGTFKVPIIRAILKSKLPDILITDENAARCLLRTAD